MIRVDRACRSVGGTGATVFVLRLIGVGAPVVGEDIVRIELQRRKRRHAASQHCRGRYQPYEEWQGSLFADAVHDDARRIVGISVHSRSLPT